MRVRLRLIQSQGEERYAKLETEILDDVGKTLGRDRVDLSLEDVGRLVCGIHVDGERIGWGETSTSSSKIRSLKRLRTSLSPDVGAEFRRLRQQWQEETVWTSSSTENAPGSDSITLHMILHPAYQMIIGLGPDVVPYILSDLKSNPHHWGWALRSITRQNPVPDGNEGDVVAISDAWLSWGRERGLI